MQNIYFNLESFFESYIQSKNLTNFLTLKYKEQEYQKQDEINFDNSNFNNIYLKSPKDSLHIYSIKEKKSLFLKELFNISESQINQIASLVGLVNNFSKEYKFNNLDINNNLKILFVEKNYIKIVDLKLKIAIFIKQDCFSILDKNFYYSEFSSFPFEEIILYLKSHFIKMLGNFNFKEKEITFNKLNQISELTAAEFINSTKKLKNFHFKSKNEISKKLMLSSGKLENNVYAFNNFESFKNIKSIFNNILHKEDYKYFCQSMDLFYFYKKYINGDKENLSYFTFREIKFEENLVCYSFQLCDKIVLNIGVNLYDTHNCKLISYSFEESDMPLISRKYSIDIYNHIIDDKYVSYSNNMSDFYMELLKEIINRTKIKINKENIDLNDIKILRILNF